jgi:hypothetical protein
LVSDSANVIWVTSSSISFKIVARMTKTKSSSDDHGTDPILSIALMEPSSSDIITSLHELTLHMENSKQQHSQLLAQFGQHTHHFIKCHHLLLIHSSICNHLPISCIFILFIQQILMGYVFVLNLSLNILLINFISKKIQEGLTFPLLMTTNDVRMFGVLKSQDHISKWHTPCAELSKFDGTGVIDWIEDYEFFFDITHTHENNKVQIIIPCG